MRWAERELRQMCAQGVHGVIAAGVIVTAALEAPLFVLQWFLR